MKRLLLGIALLSSQVWADPASLIAEFKQGIAAAKLGTISEQAFCYKDVDKVEGYQVDKLQRLASVTKVLTTLFASDTQDLNRTFTTKVYLAGDRLHIEGSRDPYFEEEKMLLLMRALNDLGYKQFKSVTFNSDFHFYDISLSSHMDITPVHTRLRLATYLNSQTNLKVTWATVRKFAEEEGFEIEKSLPPSISASKVTLSDVNPLLSENPVVYTHTSRPLHAILKSMNVMSKNYVAQNVFLESARTTSYAAHMAHNKIDAKTFKITNGSGLPLKTTNSRVDNLCSCRTILQVISLLETSLKKHNLSMSQVMAVTGGKDLGSFRERFLTVPEAKDAVIAKTGTLAQASALAGLLYTDSEIPFAILNHTTNSSGARSSQDKFVARIFHYLGNPVPLDYEKLSIFPVDNAEFLSLSTKKIIASQR
jgi:D-alanyl-D-alanine carboxypeptidase/D-alanyl-D-alanine-endopeptidase (penicillin-binding protein 4)